MVELVPVNPGPRAKENSMNLRNGYLRAALAALSGGLLALSFPPFGLWPLAWAAFVPLLLAAMESQTARGAADLGALAGLVFYSVSLHWMYGLFGPLAAAFWCIFSIWPGLFVWLLWGIDRGRLFPGLRERYRPLLFTAAAGLLWAGLEYFRAEVWWLQCAWLAIGYSQTPFTAMLQTCSLIGVYGLSALMLSTNAALFQLIKGKHRAPAAAMLLLSAALALWGLRREATFPAKNGRELKVALVQDESADLKRLSVFSLGGEAAGADLLIWPEYSFLVASERDPGNIALLAKALKGSGATAVVGAAVMPDEKLRTPLRDFMWLLSPDGKLLGRYDKMHPVPFVEKDLRDTWKNMIPNRDPRPVDTPAGRLGPQICYDLDFENGSRLMARRGAQLLAVDSLDPMAWGRWQHLQHSAMAPARAAEEGLWVARAASSGTSQIIDPAGRVRASLGPGTSGVLAGKVWLLVPGTFYSRAGWLFGPFSLLFALALSILAAARALPKQR